MTEIQHLLQIVEPAVDEILIAFDVDRPPVPVELMLQRPRDGMWPEIDLSEMSVTFLSLHDRYAPRMSAVRLLARNISRSEWGQSRGLGAVGQDSHALNVLARALLVPKSLLDGFDKEVHEKTAISFRFELPEDDAQARLEDLGYV